MDVESDAGSVSFAFTIEVYEAISTDDIAQLHEDAWVSLNKGGDLPESLQAILERPISKEDVYYLLERYATFTLWNADDLRLADGGKQINVKDVSDKFNVYDFEVCLVAAPKSLFDHSRTLTDAVKTAEAMTREVHKRQWNVEFGGFDRMRCWIKTQLLQ